MKLEIAHFLLTQTAQIALADLAAEPDQLKTARQLATLSRLRQSFEAEQAAGLLELALARERGVAKFSKSAAMFFTKSGLEQASGELVSQHRAKRFSQHLGNIGRIADLGCGIGSDSLALAAFFEVDGLDLDPSRLLFAQANAQVYQLEQTFKPFLADITLFDPSGYTALFFDPARRDVRGNRIFSVNDYQPPLSSIQTWLPKTKNIGIKVAPGVNYAQLADYDCDVEIISHNGEVKEAVLWFGELKSGHKRQATLLPSGATLFELRDKSPIGLSQPLAYLYEPDGAVIRAGLVEELAVQLEAFKLEDDIAYLTSSNLINTPFAHPYKILESLTFNLKKLNRRLNELQIGRVTIKKRGSPLEPQELEKLLKLNRDYNREVIIVLTQIAGKHSAILCTPC